MIPDDHSCHVLIRNSILDMISLCHGLENKAKENKRVLKITVSETKILIISDRNTEVFSSQNILHY